MRPKTRSTHIAGRVSVTNATDDDIDFIESKRAQNMTDTMIICQAIHIWRLYEMGQIFKDIKNELKQELLVGLTEALKNMNIAHIQTSATKSDEKEVTYPKSTLRPNEENKTRKLPSENQEIQKAHEFTEFTESELMEIYTVLNNK